MRWLLGLCAAIAALPALAQEPSKERLDEIWGYVGDRMVTQSDIWFEFGDFPTVVKALRIKLELDPSDFEAVTDLGWMLENIDQDAEALTVYRIYRRDFPNLADSPFPEAQFFFRKKLYAKVPAILEPSLELFPHANSYRALAHAYERMGLLSDSERVWKLLIARQPADEAAPVNLARVQRKLRGES